jgi:hypothetical protein
MEKLFMATLNHNVPPLKVLVRSEYLYDGEKGHGEYRDAILLTCKCIKGMAITFQVLLDDGSARDKLPCSAICFKPHEPIALDLLQLWDAPSYNLSVIKVEFLSGLRCEVFAKDKTWHPGEYLFTIDHYGDDELDLSFAEEASEHKASHVIMGDNGAMYIQPNNRIRFFDPSFTTKPFPEKPDYKVCSEFKKVERGDKWVTEDSNKWVYGVDKK